MTTTDVSEWVLLGTDLTTRLAILPVDQSHLYLELSEPGSGELKIPLDSTAAGLVTSGMFAQCNYRGSPRNGFFVENIQQLQADTSEGGGRWLSLSGRGALALLDDAIIWDDGSGASVRTFTAYTKARILKTLIEEAQARGVLTALTLDFDETDDSNAVAWTDSEDYSLNVGMSLFELVRQFASTGIDFDINLSAGSFVLSAYKNGKGSDKSETIYFRTGSNCEQVKSDERGDDIKNAYRVAWKNGHLTVSDATSITNRRRREKLLDLKQAQSSASATTYAAAIVDGTKDPLKSISVAVYDGVSPRLFEDYDIGDYVMLDVFGVETKYRVLGIQADFDGVDYSHVVVELNNILYDNDLKMSNDLDWLKNQWATAHDADLLELSFWAGIGSADDDAGSIYCSANIGRKIYFGGEAERIGGINVPSFTAAFGYGQKYPVLAIYDIDTQAWEVVDLTSTLLWYVRAMCVVGTDLYIGGVGSASGFIKKYDTLTGTISDLTGTALSASWSLEDLGSVLSIAYMSGFLYVGGQFDDADGLAVKNLVAYDVNFGTWDDFGGGITSGTVATTQANFLLVNGSDLIIGFSGTELGGVACSYIGVWSGGSFAPYGAGLNSAVYALAVIGTDIYAGGAFTGHIAVWDGSAWSVLGGGIGSDPSDYVLSLSVYFTDLIVGGKFTDKGNNIIRYSGGAWSVFDVGVDDVVYSSVIVDDDFYFTGKFGNAGGKPAEMVAAYFTNFNALVDYLEKSSTFNMGAAIHNAPASAVTDSDEFPFWEDVAKKLRKITWANIKSTAKTYFDTLYLSLTSMSAANALDLTDGGATTLHTHAGAVISETNANNIYFAVFVPASIWTGLFVAAGSSGVTIKYSTSTGAAGAMTPADTNNLAKIRLYNTTRGNSVLISNHVTGTITSTANYPANWANGDALTIASQTCIGTFGWVDLEIITSLTGKNTLFVTTSAHDTTSTNIGLRLHPLEAFAASKQSGNSITQVTNTTILSMGIIRVVSNVFCASWNNSGAASFTFVIREAAYIS